MFQEARTARAPSTTEKRSGTVVSIPPVDVIAQMSDSGKFHVHIISSFVKNIKTSRDHKTPFPTTSSRPACGLSAGPPRIMPGGSLIPAPPAATPFLTLASTTSTLARANAIAGTTHAPQLHCIPGQANLPRFAPQVAPGQDKRPDSGESGDGSGSASAPGVLGLSSGYGTGKRDGRIQVSGWRKMCAQSVVMGVDWGRTAWLRWDLWYFREEVRGSCGIMNGDVASLRLVMLACLL